VRLNEIKKLALGSVMAVLLVPGQTWAQTIHSETTVEKRTEVQSSTSPMELTGRIEVDANNDQTLTIVDDGGVRYFVQADSQLDNLRALSGQKVKVHYFAPPTDSKVVKIKSFEPITDGEIEIDRDDDGDVDIEVDNDD